MCTGYDIDQTSVDVDCAEQSWVGAERRERASGTDAVPNGTVQDRCDAVPSDPAVSAGRSGSIQPTCQISRAVSDQLARRPACQTHRGERQTRLDVPARGSRHGVDERRPLLAATPLPSSTSSSVPGSGTCVIAVTTGASRSWGLRHSCRQRTDDVAESTKTLASTRGPSPISGDGPFVLL